MRAFLAIEVPPVVKDYLQSVISGMASRVKDIRWVKKGGLHITLRLIFLSSMQALILRWIRNTFRGMV